MKYNYDCYSDIGARENNEDCFCAEIANEACLFAVADGLGGHDCGEIASATAIEVLKEQFMLDPKGFSIKKAFVDANEKILEKQSKLQNKMKTTLVAVYICAGKAVVANVGDSRGYLLKDGRIVFQTVDHSVAQTAVRVGEITADQIRYHEDRNILTRTLGIDTELKVDVKEYSELDFDSLLLCSDGFWEYVIEDEMCSILYDTGDPKKWLADMRLIHKNRIPENNDNNTAIAIIRAEKETL